MSSESWEGVTNESWEGLYTTIIICPNINSTIV